MCQEDLDVVHYTKASRLFDGLSGMCRGCAKTRRDADKDKLKDYKLQQNYGISLQQMQALVLQQGGVCAICTKTFVAQRLTHIDHDHRTGKVRAVLCHRCNIRLASVEDSAWLKLALEYLASH